MKINKIFFTIFLLSSFFYISLSFASQASNKSVRQNKSLLFLGKLYDPNYSQGRVKNAETALGYYFKAMNKGSIEAIYNIARIYELNYFDIANAIKWYNEASLKGHVRSTARHKILSEREQKAKVSHEEPSLVSSSANTSFSNLSEIGSIQEVNSTATTQTSTPSIEEEKAKVEHDQKISESKSDVASQELDDDEDYIMIDLEDLEYEFIEADEAKA